MSGISHAHSTDTSGAETYVHTVRTFAEWRSRLLRRDATEIDLWFNLDEDDAAERVVYIGFQKGQLRAELNEYEDFGDGVTVTFIREVPASRPNRRTVSVVLLPKDLGSPTESYGWQASSFYLDPDGPRCKQWYGCADWAPSANDYAIHTL